jgi:DNA-binding transcriptional LysR family regulator
MQLRVAYDARLPVARWGPLFHVFRLERADVHLEWCPVGFPTTKRPLLNGADVGVFLEPPLADDLSALTLATGAMAVMMAVGHPLARHHELRVADILDEPFPGGRDIHPEYVAFWTLEAQRGGPPKLIGDGAQGAEEGIELVASGRAISTVPAWVADGLAHPGVVSLPLTDGPSVATRLVWHTDDENPALLDLIDLATAWAGNTRESGVGP